MEDVDGVTISDNEYLENAWKKVKGRDDEASSKN